jgi:hypothetical protein
MFQLVVVVAAGWALAAGDGGTPGGWYVSGSFVSAYSFAAVPRGACGPGAGRIRLNEPDAKGEVKVLQTFRADAYRGARVRWSATLHGRGLTGLGGLVLRAEAEDGAVLANGDQPSALVPGAAGCARSSAVLDVPPTARFLSVGVSLAGGGALEFSDVALEKVPDPAAPAPP